MSETERKPVIGQKLFTSAANLLILNFLWLITSIPLVTLTDSWASMYHVLLKLERGTEEEIVKPYFRFFKANFVQSLPYTAALAGTAVIILSLFFMLGGGGSAAALGLTAVLTLIAVTVFGWVIPYFAQFSDPVGVTFANAVKLALKNPRATATIAAADGFLFALFLFAPGVFAYALYIWLAFGCAVICLIVCRALLPVFNELMPEKLAEPEAEEDITEDEE